MQSYAGKYVPAIGYYIHKNNPSAKVKINFKGVAIGDGLCDPELVSGQSFSFLMSVLYVNRAGVGVGLVGGFCGEIASKSVLE